MKKFSAYDGYEKDNTLSLSDLNRDFGKEKSNLLPSELWGGFLDKIEVVGDIMDNISVHLHRQSQNKLSKDDYSNIKTCQSLILNSVNEVIRIYNENPPVTISDFIDIVKQYFINISRLYLNRENYDSFIKLNIEKIVRLLHKELTFVKQNSMI